MHEINVFDLQGMGLAHKCLTVGRYNLLADLQAGVPQLIAAAAMRSFHEQQRLEV